MKYETRPTPTWGTDKFGKPIPVPTALVIGTLKISEAFEVGIHAESFEHFAEIVSEILEGEGFEANAPAAVEIDGEAFAFYVSGTYHPIK